MKKLAGLVIILAVLILGAYYGMGIMTERTIKKNVEVINQSNGLYAEIEQYDRGWFNSDAQIKWRLHVPERVVKDANGTAQTVPAQDYNINMPIKIHHGPIIFANKSVRFGMGYAQTVIPMPAEYNQKFDSMFSNQSTKPQLDLSIFVNYLNKSTIEMALPRFNLFSKEGTGKLEWLGMESTTTMSSGMDKVSGDVTVDGLTVLKDENKITLGKVTSEYDLHQTPAGLYLGDASFFVPTFDVMAKDQKIFSVTDLSMGTNSDIENNLFNTHFNLDLKSVLANGKTYGPGEFELNIRNLDAEILAKINQQANALQNGTDAERQQAMMAMLPELPKLFSKGAEIEISTFNFKLPEGEVQGNLFVSLPKGDSSNPFELIQKIQGKAQLKMPATLVKQIMQHSVMQQMSKQPEMQQALIQQLQSTATPANQPPPSTEQIAAMQADKQIATLQQNGVITVIDSDYAIELSLDQGKFTINNKPFDPAMMKF
ncbi:MAG TPA: YdgA family protein [Legionella sp.]|nr:YdgA family protein [Legionella sp.]